MRPARALPLVALAGMLSLWSLLAARLPPVLLPSPTEVLAEGWAARELLLAATFHTASSAAAGLLIALILGLGGAALFQLSRWVEVALYPYALLIQTLPVVAVAPLLVVWLGYGPPVAVASAAIVSFFPILTSANLGLSAASPEEVELFRVLGASRWAELRSLRLPAALPHLMGGLRTAGGLAVIGGIVGEFVGSNGLVPCLGFAVQQAARSARMGRSFAAIACAGGLALLVFGGVRLLERWTIGRWFGSG